MVDRRLASVLSQKYFALFGVVVHTGLHGWSWSSKSVVDGVG